MPSYRLGKYLILLLFLFKYIKRVIHTLVGLHVHVYKCYALRNYLPYLCFAYAIHMSLDIFASCFKLLPSIFFFIVVIRGCLFASLLLGV